jgi:hypothetical protein
MTLEQLAREAIVSWAKAQKVMTVPSFLRQHEVAMDALVAFLSKGRPTYVVRETGKEVWIVRLTDPDDEAEVHGAWVCTPPPDPTRFPGSPEWVELDQLELKA